ncbi:hypothetical protein JCGZ_01073 [Jatropha curcas]|uniref:Uncharacterized protein n=1 Tax=Jatropha curcas TaxID=180498 RepID=A0A067KSY0_JATCU|nr:hypothetical protein JCGZ_01073 [Jatropha curcas]
MILREGHQYLKVQIAPNYGFGIMSTVQGVHLWQIEGCETQNRMCLVFQALSHNGLPKQPSTDDAYLIPAATAPDVNCEVPTSRVWSKLQALPAMRIYQPLSLKESQIDTTRPLFSVDSLPGQELSSLCLNNPLYHITPQEQHLTFSHAQAGRGPFPGIYSPVQTIVAPPPATVNKHLQRPQAVDTA